MLLSDAVKRVKDRSHRGDINVTTDAITANILRAFSDTKRELIRRIPRRKLFKQDTISVVTSTPIYSLASDLQEPIIFWFNLNSQFRLLKKLDSDREFIQQIFDPNAQEETPTHYREIGPDGSGNRQIELYPTPNANFTLNYEYFKTPNTEFTTSDLSVEIADIPEQLHDAMWKGSLYKFLKSFDDVAQGPALADYNQSILDYDNQEDNDDDSEMSLRFGIRGSIFNRPNFFNPQGVQD